LPSLFGQNSGILLRAQPDCEVITMTSTRRNASLAAMAFFGLLFPLAESSGADVQVYDRVTTVGTPVTLVVRTTALFMADGGRLVDIFLDDEHLGQILTGGDGFGFLRLTPARAGRLKIAARSPGAEATGRLLVLEATDRAVLVDSEAVLKEIHLRPAGRESCRRAFESLRLRFQLIFVYRFVGADFSRSRLEKEGLSPAVVIPWKGVASLESLRRCEVQIHAVIGSAAMLAAAGAQVPRRISFEKAKGAKTVSGWEELAQALE
jgi:hypothetical protein